MSNLFASISGGIPQIEEIPPGQGSNVDSESDDENEKKEVENKEEEKVEEKKEEVEKKVEKIEKKVEKVEKKDEKIKKEEIIPKKDFSDARSKFEKNDQKKKVVKKKPVKNKAKRISKFNMSKSLYDKKDYKKSDFDLNVSVLGGNFVGKTCLIFRAQRNQFVNPPSNKKGIKFHLKLVNGCKVGFWDTQGFTLINKKNKDLFINEYYQSDVMIGVWSVEKNTLPAMKILLEHKQKNAKKMIPFILVANKIDLMLGKDKPERDEKLKEGQELADKYNVPQFQVSSKTGEGIEDLNGFLSALVEQFMSFKKSQKK